VSACITQFRPRFKTGSRVFPAPRFLVEVSVVAPIAAQITSFVLDAIREARTIFPQTDSQRMNRFMKTALKIWPRFAIAVSVSALVVVVGCGGDESGLGRRYKVSGKVTYKGATVPHGTINFLPVKPPAPEGRAATGEIKDGYYSLTTSGDFDGALPGDYNVAIVAIDADLSAAGAGNVGGMIHQGDAAHQKALKAAKSLIPSKYTTGETSGLKATVDSSGKSHDFDLTD
jgi:hypothetical protein